MLSTVPQYFQDKYSENIGAEKDVYCTPTACADLIAYYGNFSIYNRLVDGTAPLNYSSNEKAADALITQSAINVYTNSESGTYTKEEDIGLQKFFTDAGYSNNIMGFLYGNHEAIPYLLENKTPMVGNYSYYDNDGNLSGHSFLISA